MAPKSVQELVTAAGKNIGRGPTDCEPFAKILADNWFDTPESLNNTTTAELTGLGIPLRFAQQLTQLAKENGAAPREAPAARQAKIAPSPSSGIPAAAPTRREKEFGVEGSPFFQSLDVDEMDANFDTRKKIIGIRGCNVKHLSAETGAQVHLRKGDGERWVLDIGASTQDALDAGVAMAEEILSKVYDSYSRFLDAGGVDNDVDEEGAPPRRLRKRDRRAMEREAAAEAGINPAGEFTDTVEIELVIDDPVFSVRAKVLGRGSARLNEIQKRTCTRIDMRTSPHGSILLDVFANNHHDLDAAVGELSQLNQYVNDEYERYLAEGPAPKGKGKGKKGAEKGKGKGKDKGKDKGKGKGFESPLGGGTKRILKLRETEPEFDVKKRIRGKGCVNLHHIQDETSAQVWVVGGEAPNDPVRLEVSGDKGFERALTMAKDLVKSVFNDYDAWKREPAFKRARF